MDWNLNEPSRLGLEFMARSGVVSPSVRVDAPVKAAVQRIDSTAAALISEMGVFVSGDVSSSVFLAETLIAGQEEQEVTTTILYPVSQLDPESENSSVPVNAADIIGAVSPAVVDPTRYIYNRGTGGDHFGGYLKFDTDGVFTGQRILRVRAFIVASAGPNPIINHRIMVFLFRHPSVSSETRRWFAGNENLQPMPTSPVPADYEWDAGEILPGIDQNQAWIEPLGTPWAVAHLEELDPSSGGLTDIGSSVLVAGYSSGEGTPFPDQTRIYQVRLEVDHCPENRLSRDIVQVAAAGPRWTTFTPHKPDGTANLAKASGTDQTLVIRQPRYGTSPTGLVAPRQGAALRFSVPYIDASQDHGAVGLINYPNPLLDPAGAITALRDPSLRRIIGHNLKAGATQDVDSQPYSTLVKLPVSTALPNQMNQKMTPTVTATYDGVTLPLQYADQGQGVGDLAVDVRRETDNVLVATATIPRTLADEYPADAVAGWRLVSAPFDTPAALTSGVQYKIGLVAPEVGQWSFAALTGYDAASTTFVDGGATYGGIVDFGDYGGPDLRRDFSVLLYNAPAAPDFLDATAMADAVGGAVGPRGFGEGTFGSGMFGGETVPVSTRGCSITEIPWVWLQWEADNPLTNFGAYEIQRQDAVDPVWRTIALITDINGEGTGSSDGFRDYDARVGVESCYRIRTVDTFGAGSDWVDVSSTAGASCATPPVNGQRGLWFTHNALIEASLGYPDVYDSKPVNIDFTFPETDEVVRRTIYGRDGFLAFFPPERRGATFQRTLLLSAFQTPDRPPPLNADPLRDLTRAALPYVTVRDHRGGRWFANVKVLNLRDQRPAPIEYVTIDVTELMIQPSITDATYPP